MNDLTWRSLCLSSLLAVALTGCDMRGNFVGGYMTEASYSSEWDDGTSNSSTGEELIVLTAPSDTGTLLMTTPCNYTLTMTGWSDATFDTKTCPVRLVAGCDFRETVTGGTAKLVEEELTLTRTGSVRIDCDGSTDGFDYEYTYTGPRNGSEPSAIVSAPGLDDPDRLLRQLLGER